MPLRDVFAALMIAVLWGLGFIAMKIGVVDVPPVTLSALRFALAAVPAVFFFAPPKTKIWIVVAYGFAIGVLQFGFVFSAIKYGMPAGITSLLMQTQVFFTVLFAWAALGEKPGGVQLVGGFIAIAGVAAIATVRAEGATLAPFIMVMISAASWSVGNIIGKLAGRVDMVAFTIWSSLAALPPLLALAVMIDGPGALGMLVMPGWSAFFSAAFLAWGATLIGYSLWANLLSRYPAAIVAPFSLLVPVFGFLAAQIVFDEPTSRVEVIGGIVVLVGLSWIVFGADVLARLSSRRSV